MSSHVVKSLLEISVTCQINLLWLSLSLNLIYNQVGNIKLISTRKHFLPGTQIGTCVHDPL